MRQLVKLLLERVPLLQKAGKLFGIIIILAGLLPALSMGQDVTPPSGTTIGNQASATYIDADGNERTVTSNSVETVVQQVASLTVSSGLSKTVTSGGQALFPHTITNTGNGTDFFNLTAADVNPGGGGFDFSSVEIYADANQDGVPDDLNNPITETPNLGPGESFGIVIAATVPTGLTAGNTEEIELNVTSDYEPTVTASETSTATIGDAAVISVNKSMSQTTGSPGDQVTITFTFTNTGNSTGTNLNITDDLAVGFNYVADSGVWSGSGSNLTDEAGNDASGISYAYDSGANTVEATIDELTPGETGTLEFDVTIASGTEGQEISNVGTYTHDDIDPSTQQTNTVTFSVEGDYVMGPAPQTVTIDSTTQGSTIYFVNEYENQGSLEDVYNITLDNSTYPTGTTFIPYGSDGSGNPTNPLSDSNGDGIPDTGPVAPGATVQVILQVSLPIEAVGDNGGAGFDVEKTATSVEDPTESVTHTDHLGEIIPNLIDLTADAPIGDTNALGDGATTNGEPDPVANYSGNTGSTVTYDIYVNNTGPQSDNFNLSASTDNTFGTMTLPDGWSLEFRDPNSNNSVITNTGSIASGASKQVTVAVTLPAYSDADPEQSIFLRAQSSASGALDVLHTSVTLNTDRAVTVEPNHTGQIVDGSTVVYEHVLANNGNVDENDGTNSTLELELTQTESTGFISELYYDVNDDGVIDNGDILIATDGETSTLPGSVGTLTPGDEIALLVKVTALSGVEPTTTNTTTITVRDQTGTAVNTVLLPEETASDISTVVNSAVSITKRQALDDGSGNPGTYQTGDLNADPGSVIYYQIEVENGTADAVTDVEVTDVTPSYTTLSGAVAVSGDGAPVVANDPGDGNTGIIRVTASTLASGGSFLIEFAVTIDD